MPERDDPIQLLREAPVDGRRLAAVRRRVIERVGRRSWPGRWILAGAIAAAAFVAFAWTPERLSLEPPVVAFNAPEPPDWALAPTPAKTPVAQAATLAGSRALAADPLSADPHAPAIKVLAIQPAPEEGEPETALLEVPTSNPDVILYWLVDSGGD